MTNITTRTIERICPKSVPFFIRDTKLIGFALKVNPSGSIKYIAEIFHVGRSYRKTIGEHPIIALQEARQLAINFIHQVKTDQLDKPSALLPLETLFNNYTRTDRLKPNTLKNYKEVIGFYLSDWLKKPVASITKQMVEERFYKIRDKGISGGKPTYSQATKTMRILSALMNYAMADELIQSNPVQVLKLKRVDRSIKKRTNYLPAEKARELLDRSALDDHPVTLAVHLMIHTGLRKNEAMKLKWTDIEEVEGLRCLIIRDTKNSRPHYVPVTSEIQKILVRAENKTPFIFPSIQRKGECAIDERPAIKRLSKMIQHDFRCHDLRRTFATRASEVGIDYLMVKRLLNHKSNDITSQYIQWDSKENLMALKKALESVRY
jgi:integrase